MKNILEILRISVIISAIIASSFPAIFALWAILKLLAENQTNEIVYLIILFMALVGYSGWWRLLFYYRKKPIINLTLLSIGIASFIWFFSIEDHGFTWSLPTTRKEFLQWYIFLYPPLIALCFIFKIGIELFIKSLSH